MGGIKDLIESMAETDEDKHRKKIIDDTVKQVVEGMTKVAKQKRYTLISTNENLPYFQDLINFFDNEGFRLRNYKEYEEEGEKKISVDITWSVK